MVTVQSEPPQQTKKHRHYSSNNFTQVTMSVTAERILSAKLYTQTLIRTTLSLQTNRQCSENAPLFKLPQILSLVYRLVNRTSCSIMSTATKIQSQQRASQLLHPHPEVNNSVVGSRTASRDQAEYK